MDRICLQDLAALVVGPDGLYGSFCWGNCISAPQHQLAFSTLVTAFVLAAMWYAMYPLHALIKMG